MTGLLSASGWSLLIVFFMSLWSVTTRPDGLVDWSTSSFSLIPWISLGRAGHDPLYLPAISCAHIALRSYLSVQVRKMSEILQPSSFNVFLVFDCWRYCLFPYDFLFHLFDIQCTLGHLLAKLFYQRARYPRREIWTAQPVLWPDRLFVRLLHICLLRLSLCTKGSMPFRARLRSVAMRLSIR